jgi:murein DD-endopeptidase MepM/ murein hydrolase activator NlpD
VANVAGRRVADVPVDYVSPLDSSTSYVGRRRAAAPAEQAPAEQVAPTALLEPLEPLPAEDIAPAAPTPAPAPVPEPAPSHDLDTGAIERVLSALEPVDHTTSFEAEHTAKLPMLRAEPPSTGGKRRAVKHAGGRGPLFKGLPSVPVLMGIAALAVSIGGVVTVNDAQPANGSDGPGITQAASALGGTSGQGKVSGRKAMVSRDSSRDAQTDAAGVQMQAAAEGLAEQRDATLKQYARQAEKQAAILAKNLWIYPLEPVILTARFGQYGLWSSYHTGLDFNGNTGDQIHAIADGVVISAQYDGSYGNKTVIQLPDGTELWYCHQSAFLVSVGDTVHQGDVIGLVGATGHVTGSHLHVEVHPGGGDAVDPYPAMQQHGLFLGSEAQPG